MNTRSVITTIGLAAVVAVGGVTAVGWTQEADQRQGGGFPDLIGGLKSVDGCLGVETARTSSGKNVIFAWFKDKKAVDRWYYSEVHQQVMDLMGGGGDAPDAGQKPLSHIADDAGPIMVIASITMSDKPMFPGTDIPFKQIAVEIYQPLPGGVFIVERFAPEGVKVEHLHDYTPKQAPMGSD